MKWSKLGDIFLSEGAGAELGRPKGESSVSSKNLSLPFSGLQNGIRLIKSNGTKNLSPILLGRMINWVTSQFYFLFKI